MEKNQVLSEVDLLEWLNIEKIVLDVLRRQKDFPFVKLDKKNRVYFIDDVMNWLKANTFKKDNESS